MTFTKFSNSPRQAEERPADEFFAAHCSYCQRPAIDEPILRSERAAICSALALGWKIKMLGIQPGQIVGIESFDAAEMFCPRCASEFET
jgi:hypothetical protein